MRSLPNPRPKNEKEINIRQKIHKKNHSGSCISAWNLRNRIAMEHLEHINKAFRMHKYKGEGSWDLVPKDSCEVYKERRRRQIAKKGPKGEPSLSDESRVTVAKIPKKVDKSRKKKLRNTVKQKRKRRSYSDSSVPSNTSRSDTSMGTSRATASSSEMDYDE